MVVRQAVDAISLLGPNPDEGVSLCPGPPTVDSNGQPADGVQAAAAFYVAFVRIVGVLERCDRTGRGRLAVRHGVIDAISSVCARPHLRVAGVGRETIAIQQLPDLFTRAQIGDDAAEFTQFAHADEVGGASRGTLGDRLSPRRGGGLADRPSSQVRFGRRAARYP